MLFKEQSKGQPELVNMISENDQLVAFKTWLKGKAGNPQVLSTKNIEEDFVLQFDFEEQREKTERQSYVY